jgi:hypothetical protein
MTQKKKQEKPPYSGCFLTFEAGRTNKISACLHDHGEASESFSAMDWQFERREIALLSLHPGECTIDAIVLMDRMHGSGGTGKLKMRMWSPLIVELPIIPAEVINVLPSADRLCTAETFKRIPHTEWPLVLAAIKALRPELAGKLDKLVALREQQNVLSGSDQKILRLTEQRDALGLVLDIASLDRKTVLREADLSKIDTAKSVLDLLDAESVQEQDLIRKDQQSFESLFKAVGTHGRRFKGVGSREVRVYVYDKKPLETVLGIDLLIFLADFNTFLLVQYKCMQPKSDDKGETWSYLVDDQFHRQIEAMDAAVDAINRLPPPAATSMNDWRLSEEAFYFKFCETTRPNARDDALVAGITLGHSYVKQFLTLPDATGPRGGQRIGYGNCPRYLNNSQFVDLASEGWIGCSRQGYELISRVIEAGQTTGRSAMLAVIEGSGSKTALDRRKHIRL